MRIKISWDEGTTFDRECDLAEAINPQWDAEEHARAEAELRRVGRAWVGGGAAPLGLLMRVG